MKLKKSSAIEFVPFADVRFVFGAKGSQMLSILNADVREIYALHGNVTAIGY